MQLCRRIDLSPYCLPLSNKCKDSAFCNRIFHQNDAIFFSSDFHFSGLRAGRQNLFGALGGSLHALFSTPCTPWRLKDNSLTNSDMRFLVFCFSCSFKQFLHGALFRPFIQIRQDLKIWNPNRITSRC